MVTIYVNLVLQGKRSIEQIPTKWRADVEKRIKELESNDGNS